MALIEDLLHECEVILLHLGLSSKGTNQVV